MDIIFSYSRKQAIDDGVLIEIENSLLKRSGIIIPTVITSTLQGTIIQDDDPTIAEENLLLLLLEKNLDSAKIFISMLHAICSMPFPTTCPQSSHLSKINHRIRQVKTDTNRISFTKTAHNLPHKITVDIGPDDVGAPCLTIGLPEDF